MHPLFSDFCERSGEPSVPKLTAFAEGALHALAASSAPAEDLPLLLALSSSEQDEVHLLRPPGGPREKHRVACAVIPQLLRAHRAEVAAFALHAWGLPAPLSPSGTLPRPSEHPQRVERVMLTVLDREGVEQNQDWRVQRDRDAAPTLHIVRREDGGQAGGLYVSAIRYGLGQYDAGRLVGEYAPAAARPRVLGFAYADERRVADAENRLVREVPPARWHPSMRADDGDGWPALYCPVTSIQQKDATRRVLASAAGEELPVDGETAASTLAWGAVVRPLLETRDRDALRWLHGELDELPPLDKPPTRAKVGRNDPCSCGATDHTGRPVKAKRCCHV